VDSGASKHMTGSQEVFETLADWDLEGDSRIGSCTIQDGDMMG